MKTFTLLLGWAFEVCGLIFGVIHFIYGVRNLKSGKGTLPFSLIAFLKGTGSVSLRTRSATQLFLEALMGFIAAAIIFFVLLAP